VILLLIFLNSFHFFIEERIELLNKADKVVAYLSNIFTWFWRCESFDGFARRNSLGDAA
jgi:hypothetical protein